MELLFTLIKDDRDGLPASSDSKSHRFRFPAGADVSKCQIP